MGKCPNCGGEGVMLFSSFVCNTSSCRNYKPSTKQVTKSDIIKDYCGSHSVKLVDVKSTPPSQWYGTSNHTLAKTEERCICGVIVKLKQNSDTFCHRCGFAFIHPDVRCMTVARIEKTEGVPVDGPRAVFLNESSLPCCQMYHGTFSQGNEFICGHAGDGSGPRLNIDVANDWLKDYCAEASGELRFSSHVVLLRKQDNSWEQIAPHGPLSLELSFLFSSSYGGNGLRINAWVDPSAKEVFR